MFLNNRYHDPGLGAFVSVDPLVGTTGTPYLYGNGNPITLSDPSGLQAVCARMGKDDMGVWYGMCAPSSKQAARDANVRESIRKTLPQGGFAAVSSFFGGFASKAGQALEGFACSADVRCAGQAGLHALTNPRETVRGVVNQLTNADHCGWSKKAECAGAFTFDLATILLAKQLRGGRVPDAGSAATEAADDALRALSTSEQRTVRSLQQQVADHTAKLDAYQANPGAFDNLGILERAPTAEIRQSIINGRVRHLSNEIRPFQDQIDKLLGGAG